jgi:Fe-S-cluster-containing hydrogenase component 2
LCNKRCPVDAISEREKDPSADKKKRGKSYVTRDECIGCGVCVIKCPTKAIEMVPVSAEEWFHTPNSMAEWEEMRLRNMAAAK